MKGMIAPWGAELSQNPAKYAIIDLGQAAKGWGIYRRRVKNGSGLGVGWVSHGTSVRSTNRAFGPITGQQLSARTVR